ELTERQANEPDAPGLAGQIAQVEQHLVELNRRLEEATRRLQLQQVCTVGELRRLGSAWVVPPPAGSEVDRSRRVRDEEVERIAMEVAMAFEREAGWEPQDVSK